MLKEIREWFRDYKYVGHVNQKISWIDEEGEEEGDDHLTYILLEDSKGHRKVEVHSTISNDRYDNKAHMKDGTRMEFYTKSITPWLRGAHPPELLKVLRTDLDALDGGPDRPVDIRE